MQRCHQVLVDVDWKTSFQREVIMLPWRILDLTIMPGLLCDDDLVKEMKDKRLMEIRDANDRARRRVKQEQMEVDNQSGTRLEFENESQTQHDENAQHDWNHSSSSPNSDDNSVNDDTAKATSSQRRSFPNSSRIRSKTTSVSGTVVGSPRKNNHTKNPNINTNSKSPRTTTGSNLQSSRRRVSSRFNSSRITTRSTSSTTTRKNDANVNSNSTKTSRRSATTKNTAPPLSAFQRTKFNQTTATKNHDETLYLDSNSTCTRTIEEEDQNDKHEQAVTPTTGRKESLSERLRNFITGDSNIRIRDYLFDVDLSSLPSREYSNNNDGIVMSTNHDVNDSNDDDNKQNEEREDIVSNNKEKSNALHPRRRQRQPIHTKTTRRTRNTITTSSSSSRAEQVKNSRTSQSDKKSVTSKTNNIGRVALTRNNSTNSPSSSRRRRQPNRSEKEGL